MSKVESSEQGRPTEGPMEELNALIEPVLEEHREEIMRARPGPELDALEGRLAETVRGLLETRPDLVKAWLEMEVRKALERAQAAKQEREKPDDQERSN